MRIILVLFCLFISAIADVGESSIPYSSYDKDRTAYRTINEINNDEHPPSFRFLHTFINSFVSFVSRPFPHADLVSTEALLGNGTIFIQSVQRNSQQWIKWQKGWILTGFAVIVISIVLPLLYFTYRFCDNTCKETCKLGDKREKKKKNKRRSPWFYLLVFVDLFVAICFILMVCYGHYQFGELPNHLNNFSHDVEMFKAQSRIKLRKLLIDDFAMFNATLQTRLNDTAKNAINRVKRYNGVGAIDDIKKANELMKSVRGNLKELKDKMDEANTQSAFFAAVFPKIKETMMKHLKECAEIGSNYGKSMCLKAYQTLDKMEFTRLRLDRTQLVSDNIMGFINATASIDISEVLTTATAEFDAVEQRVQKRIDKHYTDVQNVMKEIAYDLFMLANTAVEQMDAVNLTPISNTITDITQEDGPFSSYADEVWFALAIIAAIVFASSSLYMFSVVRMWCRKISVNKDQLNLVPENTTVLRFARALKIFSIIIFGWICPLLLILSGNVIHLVCQPLSDPLSRPDMLSLADRFIEGMNERNIISPGFYDMMKTHTLPEIIVGCQRNETFYKILKWDERVHLSNLKELEKAQLDKLTAFIDQSLADLPEIPPTHPDIPDDLLNALTVLNLYHTDEFNQEIYDQIISIKNEYNFFLPPIEALENEVLEGGRPVPEEVLRTIGSYKKAFEDNVDPLIASTSRYLHLAKQTTEDVKKIKDTYKQSLSSLKRGSTMSPIDVKSQIERELKDELHKTKELFDDYVKHVQTGLYVEVANGGTLRSIFSKSTENICAGVIEPIFICGLIFLISLICSIPLIRCIGSNKEIPSDKVYDKHYQTYQFSTDTYAPARKAMYADQHYPTTRAQL